MWNFFRRLIFICPLLFLLFLSIACGNVISMTHETTPTVYLDITSFPLQVDPNVDFDVTVHYEMNLFEFGLKARIFLEARNLDDDSLISRLYKDNDKLGYEGQTGSVFFTCNIPEDYTLVYFTAYASPLEFNPHIMQRALAYPRDGTYPYKWSGNGVTHNIYYLESLVISDNVEGNYCYCSGITYEVFMDAWEIYNGEKGNSPAHIWNLTYNQMKSFRTKWYAADGTITGPPGAITAYGCGFGITDWDKAIQGDFVQIWRLSGSGHSVVFDGWIRDEEGNKTKIRYWSTQSSTNGVNFNEENYSNLNLETTLFARVVKPVDDDDWENRYIDANTSSQPTRVGDFIPPVSGWLSH